LGLKDVVAVAVACVALTGFGVFVIALLYQLKIPENQWSRALFLLNGVEAVAFAAAGYLFGREVNRGRAENAEQLAGSETKRGQALAGAVKDLAGPPPRRKVTEAFGSEDTHLETLARMADSLYPEVR
jgi:hypothetical protein